MPPLHPKTIVITGASSGIGLALAKLLCQRGARVFSLSISPPEKAAKGIVFLKADVRKRQSIEQALAKIPGKIDILVNNAGIMRRGVIFESREKDWDDIFAVNLKGYWLTTKLAVPRLAKNALLLFVSSIHGLVLPTNPALYALTKTSIFALAEIIKKTYPEYTVKLAAPGPADTALSRFGVSAQVYEAFGKTHSRHTPKYVAQKILRLIKSKHARLLFSWKTYQYRLI